MPTQEQIINRINEGQLAWITFYLEEIKKDSKAKFKIEHYNFSSYDFSTWLLGGIDFKDVNFENANFTNCRIINCFFANCSLKYSNFKNSNLSYYEEGSRKFEKMPWANMIIECDISNSNLKNVDFRGCVLNASNFENSDLSGSNLSETLLAYAHGKAINLKRAILKGITFPILQNGKKTLGRYTDLAIAEGLEDAIFDNNNILQNYINDVFTIIHNEELKNHTQNEEYSNILLSRIKAINLIYEEKEEPIILLTDLLELKQELLLYLKKNPSFLENFKGRIFEELVAELLSSYGWHINLTKKTRDGGYDIFAISKDISGLKSSWLIECKGWKNTVGIEIVRALYSVKTDLKVGNALLATTSHFSPDVQKFKASRYDLELKDFFGLVEWINEYKPRLDGNLYIRDSKIELK